MKNKLSQITILLFLLVTACKSADKNIQKVRFESDKKKIVNMFNQNKIESQIFLVDTDRDTILSGNKGTVLKIEKNCFVDQNGTSITGKIELELKECTNRIDMILGNLTTTSNGQLLESGGMLYLNALSNGEQLKIAENKSIGVEMPTEKLLPNMQLFEGVFTNGLVNWINPIPLNSKIKVDNQDKNSDSVLINIVTDTIHKRHNVAYNINGFNTLEGQNSITQKLRDKIHEKIFAGTGMVLKKDTSIIIDGYKVNLFKREEFNFWDEFVYEEKWVQSESMNTYEEDKNISYLFALKKLGWANIDRFYYDPRTKPIDLIVKVENNETYDKIFSSLIFKNNNVHLQGYQRKDKFFSFSHGDYEKMKLPIGENAILLVTAYKDNVPYYEIQTLTIQDNLTLSFDLISTTDEELKAQIEKNI